MGESKQRKQTDLVRVVSASALAMHLDCSRAFIGKLEADGVFSRTGDGFDLDRARCNYIRHLRRDRQQSPRGTADIKFQQAKTALIEQRLAEKRRETVPIEEHHAMLDQVVGIVASRLASLPARISNEMPVRRKAEQVVFEIRTEISDAFGAKAAELEAEIAECAK